MSFGLRYALHAVAAAFVLQLAIDAVALESQRDLFEAAEFGGAGVHHFDLPAALLGMAAVHLVQIAGEQRCLVAARAGADFHDAPRAVGVFARDGQFQQVIPQHLAFLAQAVDFRGRHLAHLGVVGVEHVLSFADLGVELLEGAVLARQARERTVLASGGRQSLAVAQHVGIDQIALELLETGQLGVEEFTHRRQTENKVSGRGRHSATGMSATRRDPPSYLPFAFALALPLLRLA